MKESDELRLALVLREIRGSIAKDELWLYDTGPLAALGSVDW